MLTSAELYTEWIEIASLRSLARNRSWFSQSNGGAAVLLLVSVLGYAVPVATHLWCLSLGHSYRFHCKQTGLDQETALTSWVLPIYS